MKKILIPLLLMAAISSCTKQTDEPIAIEDNEVELLAPAPPGNYWGFKLNAPASFGQRTDVATFVIDNKAYIFGGYDYSTNDSKKDLWEYNPLANTFIQKAGLPAAAYSRIAPVGFTINGKGYIATGLGGPANVLRDLWEYDPAADSWTQKADMPSLGRWKAVGFALNGKGYVATGDNFTSRLKDVWEYNPVSNNWQQKADLPNLYGREDAFVFVFNNKAYVGGGRSNVDTRTMYEFNPAMALNGLWTQKADYPGQANQKIAAFATNLAGFAGTGAILPNMFTFYRDFWRYYPLTNTWVKRSDFPGVVRAWAVGFSINGIGYMGLGRDEIAATNTLDLYKYIQ